MTTERSRSVPCNGCTACCQHDAIILHPECGDDPASYLTVSYYNPLTFKPALMLAKKADGTCVYLEENGCSIHDRAPVICQEFDCRRLVVQFGAARLKRELAAGRLTEAVVQAGRARRGTLNEA